MELRQRRIENEWDLLQQMAQANPALLSDIQRHQDDFLLKLSQTTTPVRVEGSIDLRSEHDVRLSFPRFFPTMPIEAYVTPPVFHPNVHPDTGFVCLWSRFSLHDTVVEALCQLQRVLTFTLFSESADHIMQPEALESTKNPQAGRTMPLEYTKLTKPTRWQNDDGFRDFHKRRRVF
jgi:ubiquitin-protein ligase